MARWQAVAPILYRALSGCPERVPAAILDDLRRRFRANAMSNTYPASELVQITSLFKEKRVPMIVFKGPVLARPAYGDLGLREFIDLDILETRGRTRARLVRALIGLPAPTPPASEGA